MPAQFYHCRIRYRRPNDPTVQGEGKWYKIYAGLGNLSIVCLYGLVSNTFTLSPFSPPK